MITRYLFALLGLLAGSPAMAQQIDRSSFSAVDAYVWHLGPMREQRLKEIIDTLSKPCQDQACIVRAIYVWVCGQVAFDCKAWHHPKQQNNSPSITLRDRKAVGAGYANLFQTMCDMAHVTCTTIHGMAKRHPEQIGKAADMEPHAWNAVQIRDRWFLCDPAWGAGTTDRRVREFTKSFTDAWFLSNRRCFALCHYPDDRKQQMLDTPISKPDFTLSPTVGPGAMIYRVHASPQMRGLLRGRQSDTGKVLTFEVPRPDIIKEVSAVTESGTPVPVSVVSSGRQLQVAFVYPEAGTYPVYLHLNKAYAFGFMATVSQQKAGHKPASVPKSKP